MEAHGHVKYSDDYFLVFKVNGYIFRGSNSAIFIFTSLLSWGQQFKEKKLIQQEKILSFKRGKVTEQDPVVQSIVSLTSLLRGHLLKCLTTL